MRESYDMDIASLLPPTAAQIKAGRCVLESFFFLLNRRTSHQCHLWSRGNTVIPLRGLLAQGVRTQDEKKNLKKMFKPGTRALGSFSVLSLGD